MMEPLGEGEAHVWFAEPMPLDRERAPYLEVLSDDERARYRRYLRDEDRALLLAAHVLLRRTLSRYLPPDPAAWRFVVGEHGRPELEDRALRFNLSHAPGLVACAVTRAADVGVDVEHTARVAEPLELARAVFSPTERAALVALGDPGRIRRRFFELWVLKEAYIKARGMGLALPLDSFSFRVEHDVVSFTSHATPPDPAEGWHFELLRPTPGHVAALAVRRLAGEKVNIVSRTATL